MEISEIIFIVEQAYSNWGFLILFLSSFVETSPLGWAIPGGTLVALGGFFAYGKHPLFLIGVIVSSWLGMLLTFLLAYYVGLKTGMSLAKKLKQEKNIERAKGLLRNHGAVILTTALLANMTRFWVSYIAGIERYNIVKFIFYASTASLAWSSLLVTVGYFAGAERDSLEKGLANLGIIAWLLLFIALGVIYWKSKKEYKEFVNKDNEDNKERKS